MKRILLTSLLSFSLSSLAQASVITHQLDEQVSFQAVTWQGNTAVASGTSGGIYLSKDDGAHWQPVSGPAETNALQFRDNQYLSNGRLLVMSAGEGADSGIFITDNEGQSWQQVSVGQTKSTFYDCLYMADDQHGWLYGDSDEQGLFVLASNDGGQQWSRLNLPVQAQASEGGFASSGTCINGIGNKGIAIGTGNGENSRLLLNQSGQWQSVTSPILGGEAGGIFTVQADKQALLVSGGSLKNAELPAAAWIYQLDKKRWVELPELPLNGAVYGSAILPTANGTEYWVSNPQGVAVLKPQAKGWEIVSQSNIWSLACQAGKGCIGVGKNGLVETYQ